MRPDRIGASPEHGPSTRNPAVVDRDSTHPVGRHDCPVPFPVDYREGKHALKTGEQLQIVSAVRFDQGGGVAFLPGKSGELHIAPSEVAVDRGPKFIDGGQVTIAPTPSQTYPAVGSAGFCVFVDAGPGYLGAYRAGHGRENI